jgi:uncharacterized protein YjiS (DUF1127 family)
MMTPSGRKTIRNTQPQAPRGLMGLVKSYLARSRAEHQLRQLDDHLLSDIGISRPEIGRTVWGV